MKKFVIIIILQNESTNLRLLKIYHQVFIIYRFVRGTKLILKQYNRKERLKKPISKITINFSTTSFSQNLFAVVRINTNLIKPILRHPNDSN